KLLVAFGKFHALRRSTGLCVVACTLHMQCTSNDDIFIPFFIKPARNPAGRPARDRCRLPLHGYGVFSRHSCEIAAVPGSTRSHSLVLTGKNNVRTAVCMDWFVCAQTPEANLVFYLSHPVIQSIILPLFTTVSQQVPAPRIPRPQDNRRVERVLRHPEMRSTRCADCQVYPIQYAMIRCPAKNSHRDSIQYTQLIVCLHATKHQRSPQSSSGSRPFSFKPSQ
ncbi:hypothetical protein ACQKWADRAFT_295461, partial [Trichoderma austrokoningii]